MSSWGTNVQNRLVKLLLKTINKFILIIIISHREKFRHTVPAMLTLRIEVMMMHDAWTGQRWPLLY